MKGKMEGKKETEKVVLPGERDRGCPITPLSRFTGARASVSRAQWHK